MLCMVGEWFCMFFGENPPNHVLLWGSANPWFCFRYNPPHYKTMEKWCHQHSYEYNSRFILMIRKGLSSTSHLSGTRRLTSCACKSRRWSLPAAILSERCGRGRELWPPCSPRLSTREQDHHGANADTLVPIKFPLAGREGWGFLAKLEVKVCFFPPSHYLVIQVLQGFKWDCELGFA